jgi:ABC-type uncharacterized transport system substrate-binding protein
LILRWTARTAAAAEAVPWLEEGRMGGIRRRQFITLLGGAAAWPLAARAQPPSKLPTIGFVGSNASAWSAWTAAFVQRLRELGWVDGRTIKIEYRWSEGLLARNAEIAAEFVRLKVDVIVTNNFSLPTLRQATEVIPIVFAMSTDPVGEGLVASLARPGGNVTGLSIMSTDLASKRLELLREVLPRLRLLAVIGNADNPAAMLEMGEVQAVALGLGMKVAPLKIRRAADIAPAFEALNADALYVVGDGLVNANLIRIMTFSLGARLPTIFNARSFVQAGGLMSYGPNYSDQFRRCAELVDKILRGAKPGDVPVEQPSRFELVLNLTTAKMLGINIPESFILRADEVIE